VGFSVYGAASVSALTTRQTADALNCSQCRSSESRTFRYLRQRAAAVSPRKWALFPVLGRFACFLCLILGVRPLGFIPQSPTSRSQASGPVICLTGLRRNVKACSKNVDGQRTMYKILKPLASSSRFCKHLVKNDLGDLRVSRIWGRSGSRERKRRVFVMAHDREEREGGPSVED